MTSEHLIETLDIRSRQLADCVAAINKLLDTVLQTSVELERAAESMRMSLEQTGEVTQK